MYALTSAEQGRPIEEAGDGVEGFLETEVSGGLGVVVLDQELSTETTCVGDANPASAFGIDVEKVVVKGVVGDWVKIAELVVDGGEVLAREVALAGLAWSDIFLGEDGGDDGVVSADGEVLPIEVRTPDCESMNHGEDFLLVGGVIHLRGKELLACKGDGEFPRWSLGVSGRVLDGGGLDGVAGDMLGQYGSNGEVGGVSDDRKWQVGSAISRTGAVVMVCLKFLLSEDREDLAAVLKVGLKGGAEDKDVIKVDDNTDFEEVAEDVVHSRLEGSGGIGESEWHHDEVVVLEPRAEGGLVGVLADMDLVEATAKVDLGKVLGSTETIKELGNLRCGELVRGTDGGGVLRGDVMEKAGAGWGGRGLVMGVEESIVVKHAREEVSKGHVGFVGEGGCKVFVAYSFDAGDEHKVGNDGGGEVVAEGADVLDEAVRGTGLAEVAELVEGVEVVDVVVEVWRSGGGRRGGVAGGGCGRGGGGGDYLDGRGSGLGLEGGGCGHGRREVTRLDRPEILASILVMDARMSVWKEDIMRMRVAISVAIGSDLCSPVSSRASSEAVNRLGVEGSHIDAGGLGHVGGMDAVAKATIADEVEAATAAAAVAVVHWEVLVWHGGMWRCRCRRGGGGDGIYNIN
ncbi:hypothetical protein CBR_g40182 [Chara braunii]|uniref:Uncharacterized protein n=1 Tax=Chara braunii TaxID=69332 RepID=A0A388LT98_CHABU|nr:hypothetical protein CBR_g40182 [Chara braunii]|eukprot:GBG85544.1 hypothetical protein CBR_g40182 [Chara braunii]